MQLYRYIPAIYYIHTHRYPQIMLCFVVQNKGQSESRLRDQDFHSLFAKDEDIAHDRSLMTVDEEAHRHTRDTPCPMRDASETFIKGTKRTVEKWGGYSRGPQARAWERGKKNHRRRCVLDYELPYTRTHYYVDTSVHKSEGVRCILRVSR